eukprot:GCRY01001536.1.p1 GENE.GCRY01001536.1~~GCRY01001536.1.p1  ORF type:complete len:340 (+),score=61.81 GCRY01001536.1:106-1125(+)
MNKLLFLFFILYCLGFLFSADSVVGNYVLNFEETMTVRSLEQMGYKFTDEGTLVTIDTEKNFEFTTQEEYEELGSAVLTYIQELLEEEYNYKPIKLPLNAKENESTTTVYASNYWKTKKTLLILIQGCGAVRPPQWARALCINNSLNEGTMFPYMDDAKMRDWGVLILNPNNNVDAKNSPIRGSVTPQDHVLNACKDLVVPAGFETVHIVAHSYGGVCVMHLLQHLFGTPDFARIGAIALTDSVHSQQLKIIEKEMQHGLVDWLSEYCLNWVASGESVGSVLQSDRLRIGRRSAGHKTHEFTSECAREDVFLWMDEQHSMREQRLGAGEEKEEEEAKKE